MLGFLALIDVHLLVSSSHYGLELCALPSCRTLSSHLTILSLSVLSWELGNESHQT